jgi:uncharacterized protein (TIGR03067 family)
MRRILSAFTIILLALPAFAADAQREAAIKKDLEQLQGQWTMKSGSADGWALPEAMLPGFRRTCQENETIIMNADQLIMKAKFTIDPAKRPKTIDYEVIDGPTKGKRHLGIYELDGDTMKSCFAAPDEDRPTDFSTKQGDHRTLSMWKRAKD